MVQDFMFKGRAPTTRDRKSKTVKKDNVQDKSITEKQMSRLIDAHEKSGNRYQ